MEVNMEQYAENGLILFEKVNKTFKHKISPEELRSAFEVLKKFAPAQERLKRMIQQASLEDLSNNRDAILLLNRFQRKYTELWKLLYPTYKLVIKAMDENGFGKNS
jgi:hypothetical protein